MHSAPSCVTSVLDSADYFLYQFDKGKIYIVYLEFVHCISAQREVTVTTPPSRLPRP